MNMGERSRPFNDCSRFGLTNFRDLTNKLCLLRFLCLCLFLCLYLFLWLNFFLCLSLFLYLHLFLCHGIFPPLPCTIMARLLRRGEDQKPVRIFILNPAPRGKVQGLPAFSKNANGYMGAHTRIGDPQSLFAIVRDLQALPILGFFFPPFLPDLGIAMKFIVLLL